jgi:hypothetical protein
MICWRSTQNRNDQIGQQLGAGDAGLRLFVYPEPVARRT